MINIVFYYIISIKLTVIRNISVTKVTLLRMFKSKMCLIVFLYLVCKVFLNINKYSFIHQLQ